MLVTRGFSAIPLRANGTHNIDNAWFDTIRTKGLAVPSFTRIDLTYADFTDAAGAQDIEAFQLAAKEYFVNAFIKHSVAFSGGSLSAYTLSLGITGDLTKYWPVPFDVFQAVGGAVADRHNDHGAMPESFSAATSLRINAVATGDTLNNATAGSAEIWVATTVLP